MAVETLDQTGRHGVIDMLKKARPSDLKNARIRFPEDFQTHQVVSTWKLAPFGELQALHEVRTVFRFDGKEIADTGEARHAMTIGLMSADDSAKRQLLENFSRAELEGVVTDFGQFLLLFDERHQRDYKFISTGETLFEGQPTLRIEFSQTAGEEGLTVFKDRTEDREPIHGEVWLRSSDWIPLRLTINTDERWSKKYTLRMEAEIDYTPSVYGLVPKSVTYKQFLNSDLVVENTFHYQDFHRTELMIP